MRYEHVPLAVVVLALVFLVSGLIATSLAG